MAAIGAAGKIAHCCTGRPRATRGAERACAPPGPVHELRLAWGGADRRDGAATYNRRSNSAATYRRRSLQRRATQSGRRAEHSLSRPFTQAHGQMTYVQMLSVAAGAGGSPEDNVAAVQLRVVGARPLLERVPRVAFGRTLAVLTGQAAGRTGLPARDARADPDHRVC